MCGWSTFLSVCLSVLIISSTGIAAYAENEQLMAEQIVINAPKELVFEAIRKERDCHEAHRKTILNNGCLAEIDEQLVDVPIYGNVHCVWRETEHPYSHIDFVLLESDHFRSGHGKWVLTPVNDHQRTILELHSVLDVGLHFPMADFLAKKASTKSVRARLERIKFTAENDANDSRTATLISPK